MMNRFFTLLLAASCLTAVGQVPDYVPTEGLVGWWPLDGSGEDLSFFENDAELFGSPTATTNRFGALNSAVLFDGVDDRLISESFAGLSGNTPFTVSFWWKVDSIDAGGVMVSYGNMTVGGTTCLRHFYLESLNGGCGEIEGLGLYSNSCLARRTDFSSYNDNSWHHCAFVYDGMGTNFAQMWLDGELSDLFVCAGSADNQAFSLESDMTGLTIGERSDGNGNYRGSLDDLFIWNRTLNSSEILELFQSEFLSGCTQINACNYDAEANHDDGSCDLYTCKCLDGTVWNAELGGCTSANTADINNDGCVQLNDLLDLLSAYGDCGAEESAWQCGDPLEYQGYDYETVQIGEQCWFAEDLRATNFSDGTALSYAGDVSYAVNSFPLEPVYADVTTTPSSIEGQNGNFGNLYNWPVLIDGRGVCPSGWSPGSEQAWAELFQFAAENSPLPEGVSLKSESDWVGGNGEDVFGFNAKPNGHYTQGACFYGQWANEIGIWWTSTPTDEGTGFLHYLYSNDEDFGGYGGCSPGICVSVRCIKD